VPQLATRSAGKTDLYGQAFAAFGTTCIEHIATATGCHASAEAVRTFATDDGRLVSTFHVGLAKKAKKCKIGSDVASAFVPMIFCALMPSRHKLVNLIARFNPRLLHIVAQVINMKYGRGTLDYSVVNPRLSRLAVIKRGISACAAHEISGVPVDNLRAWE
jgi:hypothetical protein